MHVRRIAAWVLVFGLIFSFGFGAPERYHAQEADETIVIDNPKEISSGSETEGKFEKPEVHWYKVTPKQADIQQFSHIELKVKSDQILNVSFYSSEGRAKEEDTFGRYTSGTEKGQPAVIEFPYAWEGPYFIKVEYFGSDIYEEEATVVTDNAQTSVKEEVKVPLSPEESAEPAEYSLAVKSVKLPPKFDSGSDDMCPAEVSAKGQKDGAGLLSELRLFRDGVLSKSSEGKQLSSLYYKAAPFLIAKLASKSARDEVYRNLAAIKPLIKDLNQNGESSTYVISEDEQKAISRLFAIAQDAVPGKLKQEFKQVAKQANLHQLKGKKLAAAAKRSGLKLPASQGKDRYIIKLKPGKSLSALKSGKTNGLARSSLSTVSNEDKLFDGFYVLNIGEQPALAGKRGVARSNAVASTVDQIKKLPEVEFVEPVQTYKALSADIQYPHQWPLLNPGGDRGKKGADIRFEQLQNLIKQRNLKTTRIAVVDTGVDNSLADLSGVVRMDLGKNFVDPMAPAKDDNGHGTHVSGIIAAKANNGYSMAGINQNAEILPVKVLDVSGFGDSDQIAFGIKYAADNGAKVINLSLGGQYSRVIEYALQYAAAKNVTIVAATGNSGDIMVDYPAASQYVIAVGATNGLDIVSDYSNYGKGVDVVAPGTEVPSLLPNGNVTYENGTSMATPHVAAVAGLMLSEKPNLKMAEIRTALRVTAVKNAFKQQDNSDFNPEDYYGREIKLAPGVDLVSGYGRLDAYSAFSKIDLNAHVNAVSDVQNTVSGKAVKGARVEVKKAGKVIATGKTDAKGTFSIKIPGQKAGQLLQVAITDGQAATAIHTYVHKAPAVPKVNPVNSNSTAVTGSAAKNGKIVIKNASNRVIAEGKTGKDGKFSVKIAKQKAQTVLWVSAFNADGIESKSVKVIVQNAGAPAAPKVDRVTAKSRTVNGAAEKNSSITIKAGTKTIGSGKVSQKGRFSVNIGSQKKGTVLIVTAKDQAGKAGKAVKVTVQ